MEYNVQPVCERNISDIRVWFEGGRMSMAPSFYDDYTRLRRKLLGDSVKGRR